MNKFYVLISCVLFSLFSFSQENNTFQFKNQDNRSEKIKFTSVNNLIILPVEINGVLSHFLVDTGVNKTILFSFKSPELLNTNSLKRVRIKGFGGDEELYAYQSKGNQLKINGLVNDDAEIYLFFNNDYNLTNKLGITINGIIGYELFKNFVVRVNYQRNEMKFYQPHRFNRKLRWFERMPIEFYKNKPYLIGSSTDTSIQKEAVKLLFDTGSSDALWLTENQEVNFKKPNFKDVIGYGFTGLVEGRRSQLNDLILGDYELKNVNVAYPDKTYYPFLEEVRFRDGSIGSEVMRRFTWFIDYPNQQLFFRANSDFDDVFINDMSGIVVKYDGVEVIKKLIPKSITVNKDTNYIDKDTYDSVNIVFEVVNRLVIEAVRPNSPAFDEGLMPQDLILEINGKPAYTKNLEELTRVLASGHNQKVKLKIQRGDEIFIIDLLLRDRLKVLRK